MPFTTIAKGDFCGHFEAKNYVIIDNNDWQNLWSKASFSLPAAQRPALPVIDFTQEMIIAVFQGGQNSMGYSIKIVRIVEEEKALRVSVEETRPGSNCVTAATITEPYHIIKLKKTNKEIIFKMTKEIHKC
ncbi:MAG: protease complex subunit PrcB family protein [Nitrospirae bacterium]|nr:protease complex subunit PrcB family protein [Nitrospirota bacterium]